MVEKDSAFPLYPVVILVLLFASFLSALETSRHEHIIPPKVLFDKSKVLYPYLNNIFITKPIGDTEKLQGEN